MEFNKSLTPILEFPHKALRSEVICNYVRQSAYDGVVVITCGNAGKALKVEGEKQGVGVTVLEQPKEWYSHERISKEFPNFFDATSGHLPMWLMQRIADKFRAYFKSEGMFFEDNFYFVPTGSGETIITLRLAFPETNFIALYNYSRGSQFEEKAPLNNAVEIMFPTRFYE